MSISMQVFTVLKIHTTDFWIITLCSLVDKERDPNFSKEHYLVPTYQAKWCHNPKHLSINLYVYFTGLAGLNFSHIIQAFLYDYSANRYFGKEMTSAASMNTMQECPAATWSDLFSLS